MEAGRGAVVTDIGRDDAFAEPGAEPGFVGTGVKLLTLLQQTDEIG